MHFLIAALALTTTPASPTVAAPSSLPPAASAVWSASDEEINRGLMQAFERDPNRRVCATYTPTGTQTPRSVCGTLSQWFNQRTSGEVRGRRAPHYLIEEVKERRARARTGGAG